MCRATGLQRYSKGYASNLIGKVFAQRAAASMSAKARKVFYAACVRLNSCLSDCCVQVQNTKQERLSAALKPLYT